MDDSVRVVFRTEAPTSGLLWVQVCSTTPGAIHRGSDHRMVLRYPRLTAFRIVELLRIGVENWLKDADVPTSLIYPYASSHIQIYESADEVEIHLTVGGVALMGPTDDRIAFTEPSDGWRGRMTNLYAGILHILQDIKETNV